MKTSSSLFLIGRISIKSISYQILLLFIGCISEVKIPKGSLDPRNFKELYYIDKTSFLCKSARSIHNNEMAPEAKMKSGKNCSFQRIINSDIFFLKCDDARELQVYTLDIGSCFEAISSYKRDYTKELR